MYVELKNINKSFKDFKASNDVNFSIEEGKLIGLLGPSGSGKTTILRMIAGLETPDSGDIIIGGTRVNDIPAGKRGIGFVFQNYALFRHMTVFENIAFGLQVQKKDKKFLLEMKPYYFYFLPILDFLTLTFAHNIFVLVISLCYIIFIYILLGLTIFK